jgi:oligopeptide/dipeptide ABC transporter ATP-binding protein
MPGQDVLLEVKNVNISFKTEGGMLRAVDGISFDIHKGEILGMVGESGCGKSITSLSLMGLEAKNCLVDAEAMIFNGRDISRLSKSARRELRGKDMAMIFQEPLTSLNPLFTIGYQITETIKCHNRVSSSEAKKRALEILHNVEIPRPEAIMSEYPNALSGGMRQRVMIAIALVNNPVLLIADEPTTALDVTIQAQILRLMKHLIAEYGTTIMLITHDLGVVAETADRVLVMYAGQIVEEADVFSLFHKPLHPYTRGLMGSTIHINRVGEKLPTIPGTVPTLEAMPQEGCRFCLRCAEATGECSSRKPEFVEISFGHRVRCLRHEGGV